MNIPNFENNVLYLYNLAMNAGFSVSYFKTKLMEKKLQTLFVIILLIFVGCKKENQPPTCEILSPEFGSTFKKGEMVTISVDASDEDGTISEVRFYVDGIGKSSSKAWPYNFDWDTDQEGPGNHIIKVVAIDNLNLEGEATINITILMSADDSSFTYEGREYRYKTIGSQTWMVENLGYLPAVSPSSIGSDSSPHYYIYGNEGSSVSSAKANDNYSDYGVLYNWEAAKTACPDGWHLPSDEEWKTLEKLLGMIDPDANNTNWRESGDVGKKLKFASGWYNNGNGDNSSGFSAFPSGRGYDGVYSNLGNSAFFWTSSEDGLSNAIGRTLNYGTDGVYRGGGPRRSGFSVRCLKD